MATIFTSFDEIEDDLKKNAPPVVYKYRSWKEENHRRLLTHQEVWFSHPFGLSDPLDVRPEIIFDPSELNDPAFLQRLFDSVSEVKPELVTERDRTIAAENQLDVLKSQPSLI